MIDRTRGMTPLYETKTFSHLLASWWEFEGHGTKGVVLMSLSDDVVEVRIFK